MKCYCGFDWTEEAIMKGLKKDEFGEFFRCTVDPDKFDEWNSCIRQIAAEYGNGHINNLFEPLYKEYLRIKEERRIKKLRDNHHCLEEFL